MNELMEITQSESNFSEEAESCLICGGRLSTKYSVFENSSRVECCLRCGAESLRPMPTPEQVREYYTNYPPTRTSERDLSHLVGVSVKSLEFYLSKMDFESKPRREISFMEIGFGNGASLYAASKLKLNAYGIDLDEKNIADTKTYCRSNGVSVSCLQGGVDELQDFGKRFDIVKVSQVIEHVLNPLDFMSKIGAAQSRGGYLIVDCPNNAAAFWLIKNMLRKVYDREDFYNALKLREHLWGFTKRSLSHLLERSGYELIFCRDFMMGSEIFQPESSLWYPTLAHGMRLTLSTRTPYFFLKACIRAFDSVASACLGRGMGLVVMGRKTGP